MLILSLFPGVGLLDRAFEDAGLCVVRAPDLIHGGDIARWHWPPPCRIDGIIAGPPCQGFSVANAHRTNANHPSVLKSRSLLQLTVQIIEHCRPSWAIIENVPNVPDVRIHGYQIQRIAINDYECGGNQLRWRCVQFAHKEGCILRPHRVNDRSGNRRIGRRPESITTKPTSRHQTFAEQCRRQGLASPFELPGWTCEARFRAVGNGVPLSIGRAIAAAVQCGGPATPQDCACGCGRAVAGGIHKCATPACRKRIQLDRDRARPVVTSAGYFHHPAAAFPRLNIQKKG